MCYCSSKFVVALVKFSVDLIGKTKFSAIGSSVNSFFYLYSKCPIDPVSIVEAISCCYSSCSSQRIASWARRNGLGGWHKLAIVCKMDTLFVVQGKGAGIQRGESATGAKGVCLWFKCSPQEFWIWCCSNNAGKIPHIKQIHLFEDCNWHFFWTV